MKSIIHDKKECYICRQVYDVCETRNLEKHHCIHGTANRRLADKFGLWIWLCQEHHRGNCSVHMDNGIDIRIKKIAQTYFEIKTGTREDFIKIFGKSYL